MASPLWTDGLKKCGQCYEGIVKNAPAVLELHKQDTVSTFGVYGIHCIYLSDYQTIPILLCHVILSCAVCNFHDYRVLSYRA